MAAQRTWTRVAPAVDAFETQLPLTPWALTLHVVLYRKRVGHPTRKNFQLDLFTPDDGHFENSTVTTNKMLTPAALWAFMAGWGAQEKTLAELKGEFAIDDVPTNQYGANSAWQQLSVLAHNLLRGFQLQTLANPKPRSRKRTYVYAFRSMHLQPAGPAHGPGSGHRGTLSAGCSCFGCVNYSRITVNSFSFALTSKKNNVCMYTW